MKVEIKSVKPASVFKVSLYFMVIPFLMLSMFSIISILFGLISLESNFVVFGIMYIIVMGVAAAFSGVLYMLFAFVYNALDKRFGGLEIELEEQHSDPAYYQPPSPQQYWGEPRSF